MESTIQLETKRSSLLRTAQAIVDKAIRENRALRPAEEVDIAGMEDKIDAINRTLGRASLFGRNHGDPSMTFVRCVLALAGSSGDRDSAMARADAKSDHEVTRALSASIGALGGFAVPTGYSGEIIEALRPLVAVRKLNPVVLPMTNGNLTWPRIATGGSVGYIGENNPVPLSQAQQFAALRLSAKKLTGIVPISNDFVRYARPAGDVIVREDIVASLASAEDFNFINGNGTGDTPKGLINWCLTANQIGSNQTVSLTNTDADLGSLESALMSASVRMLRPGWIFAPRTLVYLKNLRGADGAKAYPELDRGLLRGYPYAATTNVPINLGNGSQSLVILADFADVVIGEAELVIDAGRKTTYTDANGNTISAFQQDQTVVRIVAQHDIGMRHQESIAMLTGVSWIPTAA